jgi:hypothetical protein
VLKEQPARQSRSIKPRDNRSTSIAFSISFSILLVFEAPSRISAEPITWRLHPALYVKMAQSLEAKIVVLGAQGVGKTSLVHR